MEYHACDQNHKHRRAKLCRTNASRSDCSAAPCRSVCVRHRDNSFLPKYVDTIFCGDVSLVPFLEMSFLGIASKSLSALWMPLLLVVLLGEHSSDKFLSKELSFCNGFEPSNRRLNLLLCQLWRCAVARPNRRSQIISSSIIESRQFSVELAS